MPWGMLILVPQPGIEYAPCVGRVESLATGPPGKPGSSCPVLLIMVAIATFTIIIIIIICSQNFRFQGTEIQPFTKFCKIGIYWLMLFLKTKQKTEIDALVGFKYSSNIHYVISWLYFVLTSSIASFLLIVIRCSTP